MKLKEGDIFTIPLDNNQIVFGQIINIPNENNFIIAVYDYRTEISNIPELLDIVKNEIVLIGYTLDAKLYHKHWVIIGNHIENIPSIPLPIYKLGTPPGDIYVVNYKGDIIRSATIEEFNLLDYQSCRAPIGFEKVLKEYYKEQPLSEGDEKLLYSNLLFKLNSISL